MAAWTDVPFTAHWVGSGVLTVAVRERTFASLAGMVVEVVVEVVVVAVVVVFGLGR